MMMINEKIGTLAHSTNINCPSHGTCHDCNLGSELKQNGCCISIKNKAVKSTVRVFLSLQPNNYIYDGIDFENKC